MNGWVVPVGRVAQVEEILIFEEYAHAQRCRSQL